MTTLHHGAADTSRITQAPTPEESILNACSWAPLTKNLPVGAQGAVFFSSFPK